MLVVLWLAAALVLGPAGPQVISSPPFETAEDCARAQEEILKHPTVIGVSPCYKVEIEPRKTGA